MDTPLLSLRDGGLYFSTIDYLFFIGLLAVSVIIGIYFGFISKRKQDNTDEYLMGSKTMKIFPVAVSLTATHISAITILGVPSEMYRFGIQYWAATISGVIVMVCIAFLYLPVFYELQATTMFTYLDRRFDRSLRRLASGLYSFATFISLPVLVYAPAIAFSQVTGVNLHVITPVISVICIFYTTFGGLRAVVWTDTLQFIAMLGGILVVMVVGTQIVGGVQNVYDINEKGGRLIWFNLDPDPTSRSTFWGITIGMTAYWISIIGVTPECMQRYLSVPTFKDSLKVVGIFGVSHIFVKMFSVYCGLLIYAKYSTCDPVTIGIVEKPDQIFPYFVMDVARHIPGLPGIFVAGVFSAALSTLSSSLNSLSGAIYGDFLKPMMPNASEKTSSNMMKIIVVTMGAISIGFVFVVEKLGNIFMIAMTFGGVTAGTLLGMFTLGMAFPRANKKGAFWGSILSMAVVIFLAGGAQIYIGRKQLNYETLPFHTESCDALGFTDWHNSTKFVGTPNSTTHIYFENFDNTKVPYIFRMGFMYYSFIGALVVLISGYAISIMTGGEENVDQSLLWPCIRKLKPLEKYNLGTDPKKITMVMNGGSNGDRLEDLNKNHVITKL